MSGAEMPADLPVDQSAIVKNSLTIIKEYAKDISRTPDIIASITARPVHIVNTVMNDYAASFAASYRDPDFPKRLMDFYRTEDAQLDAVEIEALRPLILPIAQRIESFKRQASQQMQQQPQMMPGNNPAYPQSPMDQMMPSPQMGYNNMQQQSPMQGPVVDTTTNAGLLKSILLNMTREHPQRIENFINGFRQAEGELVSNPVLLRNLLHMNFGPLVAENVTNFFTIMRPKHVVNGGFATPAQGGMDMGGFGNMAASMMSGMSGMGGGTGGMGGGMSQMPNIPQGLPPQMVQWYLQQWFDMNREAEADRRAERAAKAQERQLQQYTSMLMSTMMARMMEAQTPTTANAMAGMNPMGQAQAMEEIMDPNTGKVIGRKFIPTTIYGPGQSGQQQHNPAYDMMLKTLSEERNILLQKVVNGNPAGDINNTLLSSVIQLTQQRMDPFGAIKAMKESMPELFGSRQPLDIDTLRAKWDSDMQMLNAKMKFKEMEHQWEREDKEKVLADKNMDRIMGGLSQLGNQILGPAINTAMQTWANNSARAKAAGVAGAGPQQQQQAMYAPQQPPMSMGGMAPQPSNPMENYQAISPEMVMENKRKQLESFTDQQIEELRKSRDQAALELQSDGPLIDQEIQRRRMKQQGTSVAQAQGYEAGANPGIISDPSTLPQPTPPA